MSRSNRLAFALRRLDAWRWSRQLPRRQAVVRAADFPAGARRRLLLVTTPDSISQSQVFPFHFHRDELRARWGYEIREAGLAALLAAPPAEPIDADLVCFQAWIDKTPEQLRAIVALLRRLNPRARLAFLDPCAPTDLRFAASIGAEVDFYVKKHVLRDRGFYDRPTLGDTNLTDWYARQEGEDVAPVLFQLPPGFMTKLLVGPSFVTAPYMLPRFATMAEPPAFDGRSYQLHARLGGIGTGNWYERMRTHAQAKVDALADVRVTPQGRIGKRAYLRELRESAVCFSPFGYGEVCWRDYEAVHAGALLVKPDMSHMETVPDVFVPGETYLPLRWDFADFEDVVRGALADPARCRRIVGAAYDVLHRYAREARFVDQLQPLFDIA